MIGWNPAAIKKSTAAKLFPTMQDLPSGCMQADEGLHATFGRPIYDPYRIIYES